MSAITRRGGGGAISGSTQRSTSHAGRVDSTITPVTVKLPRQPDGVPREALEQARGLMKDSPGVSQRGAAFFGRE